MSKLRVWSVDIILPRYVNIEGIKAISEQEAKKFAVTEFLTNPEDHLDISPLRDFGFRTFDKGPLEEAEKEQEND